MITQVFDDLDIRRERPDISTAISLYQIAITLEEIREELAKFHKEELISPFDE